MTALKTTSSNTRADGKFISKVLRSKGNVPDISSDTLLQQTDFWKIKISLVILFIDFVFIGCRL